MTRDPLRILHSKEENSSLKPPNWRNALRAKFERLWLLDPEQFNPKKNVKEEERIHRTFHLIKKHFKDLKDKKIADIGCGYGVLTNKCLQEGGLLTAVDLSQNALNRLKSSSSRLKLTQSCLPSSLLLDAEFDLVICTDVIAYLPQKEFRIFFSELARIIKPDGILICSTPIDIQTDHALERFAALAETEFNLIEWKISFHAFWIRLERILPEILKKPFHKSTRFLYFLESLCRFVSNEKGISHAIFAAKLKPLFKPTAEQEKSQLRPTKKLLWE